MRNRIQQSRLLSAIAAVLAGAAITVSTGCTSMSPLSDQSPGEVADRELNPCSAEQEAVRAVPHRVRGAWERNDAASFSAAFTPDAHLIVPDGTYLRGRDEIRSYMAQNFAGPARGSRVTVDVLSARCVSGDVGVVTTTGGILLPGEGTVPPERVGIQTWVVVSRGGEWLTTAYENARIN